MMESPTHNFFPSFRLKRTIPLFREGDPCTGAWIVMRGRVALDMKAASRRRITITQAEPGDVLALSEAISGTRYSMSAVAALKDCEVRFIPRDDVLHIMESDPLTRMELLHVLSDGVRTVYQCLRNLKFRRKAPAHMPAITNLGELSA